MQAHEALPTDIRDLVIGTAVGSRGIPMAPKPTTMDVTFYSTLLLRVELSFGIIRTAARSGENGGPYNMRF